MCWYGTAASCDFFATHPRPGWLSVRGRDLDSVDACLDLGERVCRREGEPDLGTDLAGGAIDLSAGSPFPARPAAVGPAVVDRAPTRGPRAIESSVPVPPSGRDEATTCQTPPPYGRRALSHSSHGGKARARFDLYR